MKALTHQGCGNEASEFIHHGDKMSSILKLKKVLEEKPLQQIVPLCATRYTVLKTVMGIPITEQSLARSDYYDYTDWKSQVHVKLYQ